MSAEEKGSIDSVQNTDLNPKEANKAPTPVEISDESSDDNTDTDEESANCEEMTVGNKTYAVEIGSEPRSVYTLEGEEIGTYTEENGIQLF